MNFAKRDCAKKQLLESKKIRATCVHKKKNFAAGFQKAKFAALLLAVLPAFFGGCSVDYGTVYESESSVPELMLDNANFSRIEQGQTTAQISSERLEKFKNSGKVFAQNIRFETRDENGETNATGKAGLMSADTDEEIYEFFGGIEIRSETHNVRISGESLKWNGKTEQLVGERGKEITIEKDGITLSGQDFSASAVSERFSFGAEVRGSYVDEEKAEGAEAQTEDE